MSLRWSLLAAAAVLVAGTLTMAGSAGASAAHRSQATAIRPGGVVRVFAPGGLIRHPAGRGRARDETDSTNWSGYALSGPRGAYTAISTSWTQPAAACGGGGNEYAAFWVGLDGFNSNGVEQTGTDSDCSAAGGLLRLVRVLPGRPGVLQQPDRARGQHHGVGELRGAGHVHPGAERPHPALDPDPDPGRAGRVYSSAEVITEAPSSSSNALPLADFNRIDYTRAKVNGTSMESFNPRPIVMVTPDGTSSTRPAGWTRRETSATRGSPSPDRPVRPPPHFAYRRVVVTRDAIGPRWLYNQPSVLTVAGGGTTDEARGPGLAGRGHRGDDELHLVGTTGLYDYARPRLAAWIDEHADDPEVRQAIAQVRGAAVEVSSTADVVAVLHRWMASDIKATPLKTLQGQIWAAGFVRGNSPRTSFPTSRRPPCDRWRSAGVRLAAFSSTSVTSQQCSFRHAPDGDMSVLVDVVGRLRTQGLSTTGAHTTRSPRRSASLRAAAVRVQHARRSLGAAQAVGLQVVGISRPGEPNMRASFGAIPAVTSFDELTGHALPSIGLPPGMLSVPSTRSLPAPGLAAAAAERIAAGSARLSALRPVCGSWGNLSQVLSRNPLLLAVSASAPGKTVDRATLWSSTRRSAWSSGASSGAGRRFPALDSVLGGRARWPARTRGSPPSPARRRWSTCTR